MNTRKQVSFSSSFQASKTNLNFPFYIFSTFFAKNIAKRGVLWYNSMSHLFI